MRIEHLLWVGPAIELQGKPSAGSPLLAGLSPLLTQAGDDKRGWPGWSPDFTPGTRHASWTQSSIPSYDISTACIF